MKIRSIPDLQGFIALRGRVIVDTYRGQVRIRGWPKKQTPAHKAKNANQIRWFAAAREMAKWAAPHEINASKLVAKGKGFYPGDIQMMAAAGNLVPLIQGDPDNYEKWQPFLDPVSFQGARLPLAANQAIPSGSSFAIWGVPTFQTTQFWTAGDPTKIVIPTGVTVVNLTFFGISNFSGTTAMGYRIQKNGGADRTAQINPNAGTAPVGGGVSGPLQVVAGDYFKAELTPSAAGTLIKSSRTYFTIEVLETDV